MYNRIITDYYKLIVRHKYGVIWLKIKQLLNYRYAPISKHFTHCEFTFNYSTSKKNLIDNCNRVALIKKKWILQVFLCVCVFDRNSQKKDQRKIKFDISFKVPPENVTVRFQSKLKYLYTQWFGHFSKKSPKVIYSKICFIH